jgi:hypothetical protein
MSGAPSLLPAGFEVLEGFVEQWSLAGTAKRGEGRNGSSVSEREAFYETASPLLTSALELLDRKPLNQLDAAEERLMDMMLSLTHVALAVETQREAETTHVVSRRTMTITRSSADWLG